MLADRMSLLTVIKSVWNRSERRPAKSALLAVFDFSLLIVLSLVISASSAKPSANVAVTSPLEFTVSQGGGALRSRALELRNPETTNLEWTAFANQAWLRFEPASGSLAPGATISIDLIADPAGFSPGIYEATVKIATPTDVFHTLTAKMVEEPAFAGAPVANTERTFPSDSGMVNVKSRYGAKGDGISDDSESIQLAISSVVHHPQLGPRIIFFPAGIYLISRPLLEKDLNGQWNSLLTLQGENRATTILKLTDNNPLYQNMGAPAAVLKLASQHGGPNGGGNSAFDNNMFDMTIDVGRGNPGAIALDFLGNNYCALRNVTLQSGDPNHSGAVGLSFQRYASGPCFMKNVLINGFDYGIRTAHTEYSLTFEDLTVLNQKVCGIYNIDNVISVRHLLSKNSAPAICNHSTAGLVIVIGARLQNGSSKDSAIQNQGTLYVRDVTSSGYASAVRNKGEVVPGTSIYEYDSGPVVSKSSRQPSGNELSLNLPVEETPYYEDTALSNWKNVVSSGADAKGQKDSAAAIQSAIDSGATTIYFPTGVYIVAHTLHLRGKVRVLEGFGSSLNPSGIVFQDPSHLAPLFSIEAGTAELAVNHIRIAAFYPHPCPGVVAIQQNSARPLVLRDSLVGSTRTTVAYRNTFHGMGTLFVENVAGQPWQVAFPQNVFARQINPEGGTTKITNAGGTMWILGLKTEGIGTNITTEARGSTEVLGGLVYPVWKVPEETPGFIVSDSRASFIYAVSNYNSTGPGSNFNVQIEEDHGGVKKSVLSTFFPARGLGRIVALYRSADDRARTSEKTNKNGTAASD